MVRKWLGRQLGAAGRRRVYDAWQSRFRCFVLHHSFQGLSIVPSDSPSSRVARLVRQQYGELFKPSYLQEELQLTVKIGKPS